MRHFGCTFLPQDEFHALHRRGGRCRGHRLRMSIGRSVFAVVHQPSDHWRPRFRRHVHQVDQHSNVFRSIVEYVFARYWRAYGRLKSGRGYFRETTNFGNDQLHVFLGKQLTISITKRKMIKRITTRRNDIGSVRIAVDAGITFYEKAEVTVGVWRWPSSAR